MILCGLQSANFQRIITFRLYIIAVGSTIKLRESNIIRVISTSTLETNPIPIRAFDCTNPRRTKLYERPWKQWLCHETVGFAASVEKRQSQLGNTESKRRRNESRRF